MDGYLSQKTVQDAVEILKSSQRTRRMVDNNYQIAARHYSYAILRSQLAATIRMFYGDAVEPLTAGGSIPRTRTFCTSIPRRRPTKAMAARIVG
jgi:hypothetical protein